MEWESVAKGVFLFAIAIVFLGGMASATSVAIYGSSSGFLPESHKDITAEYEIPGNSGSLLDQTVDGFTDPSIAVIFIGNDADFSSGTALAIENAVYDGKVLVISYPATEKFDDSLPVTAGSVVENRNPLLVTSLSNGIARSVFSGLAKTFSASENVTRLTGILKPGSISLMSFNDSYPALAYRQYGNGYVVEWLIPAPQSYLGDSNADTVNYRVIEALLEDIRGTSSETTVATTVPTTTATTVAATTGSVIIQSSPLGARVYVDGRYLGKTPLQLEDVPAGYHAIRMTLDGYYDFDSGTTISKGETETVFGSLQEAPETTAPTEATTVATPVPTTVVTETTASSSDPLANPTVIAAGIGIITAGIGAYATIYTHKGKKE